MNTDSVCKMQVNPEANTLSVDYAGEHYYFLAGVTRHIELHRPRKVLVGRSPHEVLFGVEMRYTKPPLAVALQT